MGKQKLVLIGNGMAGVRCVEEILALAPDRFEITIFGSEPHPNYNRIMLSKVLQGSTTVNDITINDWQWYEDKGITLYAGDPVISIDTAKRSVVSEKGRRVEYDQLILATGSLPFMLPLPGADKPGVTAFRDINDCNKMIETSKNYKKAVVIGGGLLGLEAARGLLNLGMDVHVVHIYHHLMERQLSPTSAGMLRRELEKQGMKFLLEKQTEKILGKKRVEGLLFKDGSKVEADLIVIAVGVRPNIKLAAESGIETNRAIMVDDYMETNVPGVYAVGECAEHRNMVYGLVAPLYEQGKVLAKKICGIETEGYQGSILYSQLKVSGVEVFSAGEIRDSEITTALKVIDGIKNTYKKIAVRNNKIVGAVLFGDSSEGNKLLGYIKQQADVSVLEEASAVGGGADEAYASSLALTATVCSCNGVTKGGILDAVRDNGCATVEDIRACTRASSTCGGCKPLVSAMLQLALQSQDAPAVPKETVCGCTSHSHDELRDAVRSASFETAHEAMHALGWNKADGCAICRPAVQYYLGQARGAAADKFGTESMTLDSAASLLADGTYAITPRMYGGVTNAEQLRLLADIIDKYRIPLVKLTGGAHLDLLGIAEEQVNAIGAEIGHLASTAPSYGKIITSVATCAGKDYDRSALQDSIKMGIGLEHRLDGMQMPTQVTVAVSASPLHRAGTLTKDLGLVGVPGGWEIYVGGSAGTKLRQAELFCMESNEDTVLDLAIAFFQWYREEANFGETTGQWVERKGITQLREHIFNLTIRMELLSRWQIESKMIEYQQVNSQPTAALAR